MGLEEKADCAAGTLSGGSKRKLQVGIALLADSHVVLLDEPSSGADRSSNSCTAPLTVTLPTLRCWCENTSRVPNTPLESLARFHLFCT